MPSTLRGELEACAQEGGSKLRDQFLHGVAFVAEALASEVAIESAGMASQMTKFMEKRGIIALGVTEGLERQHLNVVAGNGVVSAASAMADIGAGRTDEFFRVRDAL
jgi:hypothetical protein